LTIPSVECYITLEQHQPIAMRRANGGFLRELVEGIEFTAECVQEPDPEYEVSE
jgi:hypothetical protein